MTSRSLCLLAAALVGTPGARAGAQSLCEYEGTCAAWWAEELAVASSNVLLGGLAAGLWQELRGGSFRDGFTRGALGGALGYAGKRIVTGDFPGAGLLGRQVAAVGHSIIRNAAEGRGTLDRVALPLLFLPAHVQLGAWGHDARVRVDLLEGWYFVYGLLEPRLELDWGRSLSWGAAVFLSDGYDFRSCGIQSPALAPPGTILVNRDRLASPWMDAIASHERVHIPQTDFLRVLGEAGDDWLETRVRPLAWLSRYVAPNITAGLLILGGGALQGSLDHYHLPWELEAIALGGRVW